MPIRDLYMSWSEDLWRAHDTRYYIGRVQLPKNNRSLTTR